MSTIKNILFDLGNVLVPIDFQRSINAFIQLGVSNFDISFEKVKNVKVFHDFEIGLISPNEFRNHLRKGVLHSCTDQELDNAWNAIILPFPVEVAKLLDQVAQKYDLYLLSNTNKIHCEYFNNDYKNVSGGKSFADIFKKTYYSHELHQRKPSKEIFLSVLTDSGINANETVFLDDLKENLKAPEELGFQTIWVEYTERLGEYISQIENLKK